MRAAHGWGGRRRRGVPACRVVGTHRAACAAAQAEHRDERGQGEDGEQEEQIVIACQRGGFLHLLVQDGGDHLRQALLALTIMGQHLLNRRRRDLGPQGVKELALRQDHHVDVLPILQHRRRHGDADGPGQRPVEIEHTACHVNLLLRDAVQGRRREGGMAEGLGRPPQGNEPEEQCPGGPAINGAKLERHCGEEQQPQGQEQAGLHEVGQDVRRGSRSRPSPEPGAEKTARSATAYSETGAAA